MGTIRARPPSHELGFVVLIVEASVCWFGPRKVILPGKRA